MKDRAELVELCPVDRVRLVDLLALTDTVSGQIWRCLVLGLLRVA
jgi:hypothetical protein